MVVRSGCRRPGNVRGRESLFHHALSGQSAARRGRHCRPQPNRNPQLHSGSAATRNPELHSGNEATSPQPTPQTHQPLTPPTKVHSGARSPHSKKSRTPNNLECAGLTALCSWPQSARSPTGTPSCIRAVPQLGTPSCTRATKLPVPNTPQTHQPLTPRPKCKAAPGRRTPKGASRKSAAEPDRMWLCVVFLSLNADRVQRPTWNSLTEASRSRLLAILPSCTSQALMRSACFVR